MNADLVCLLTTLSTTLLSNIMQKGSSLSLSGKSAKKMIGFDPKPAIVQVRSNYLLTQILNHSRLIQEEKKENIFPQYRTLGDEVRVKIRFETASFISHEL